MPGYTAQAYADDLAIVIQDKHLNTVTDLMQGSLKVVDSWRKTKGLSVNPEKTESLLFTRKRKSEGVVRLEHQGVKLNLTKEVKYLGIILDDKLTWKAHARAQERKGLRAPCMPLNTLKLSKLHGLSEFTDQNLIKKSKLHTYMILLANGLHNDDDTYLEQKNENNNN